MDLTTKHPTVTSSAAPMGGILTRFRKSEDGVAAIEFALVLPIMIGMYFMLNETTHGLRAARKVTMTARVMADLTSRPNNITTNDKNDIFASAKPILSPYDNTKGSYRITSIRFKPDGKGYVDWSDGTGNLPAHARCKATEGAPGVETIAVPAALRVANTSVILAEVSYKYQPVVGYNMTGPIDLSDQLFMRPRGNSFVTREGVTSGGC